MKNVTIKIEDEEFCVLPKDKSIGRLTGTKPLYIYFDEIDQSSIHVEGLSDDDIESLENELYGYYKSYKKVLDKYRKLTAFV